MGSTATKIVGKFMGADETDSKQNEACQVVRRLATPLIYCRRGSQYFDEDGDLAHEFYIEVPAPKRGMKASMKRIFKNLRPQGDVKYPHPRLHVDIPVVLYQG